MLSLGNYNGINLSSYQVVFLNETNGIESILLHYCFLLTIDLFLIKQYNCPHKSSKKA